MLLIAVCCAVNALRPKGRDQIKDSAQARAAAMPLFVQELEDLPERFAFDFQSATRCDMRTNGGTPDFSEMLAMGRLDNGRERARRTTSTKI
jgi:hypothetical protein